jgi:hypothetical protein
LGRWTGGERRRDKPQARIHGPFNDVVTTVVAWSESFVLAVKDDSRDWGAVELGVLTISRVLKALVSWSEVQILLESRDLIEAFKQRK